jgi:C4-dicarboxylate-specific signal transduction histidine kinase
VRSRSVAGAVRRVDRFDIVWHAPNGKRRNISVVAAPMSGHGLGAAYAFADVTEQRRTRDRELAQQAALAHASRLSLMGQMASALAHELGQPLNACQSYLGGLKHRLTAEMADRPELEHALNKAIEHLDQASGIIRNVRSFVARNPPEFQRVDLVGLVQQTVALLDVQLRAGQARVKLDFGPGTAPVRCHPVEIQQVLVNLVVNAIEAMNDVPPDERLIEIATGAEGRSKVGIEIRDSGPGVPVELSQRIFDPYFTTKGSGIGMGLMISRTIVESHGGSLQLLTGRAQRTSFRFTLPIDHKAQR